MCACLFFNLRILLGFYHQIFILLDDSLIQSRSQLSFMKSPKHVGQNFFGILNRKAKFILRNLNLRVYYNNLELNKAYA